MELLVVSAFVYFACDCFSTCSQNVCTIWHSLYMIVVIPIHLVLMPGRHRMYNPLKNIPIDMLVAQIDILEVDGKYYGFSGCHRYDFTLNPKQTNVEVQ